MVQTVTEIFNEHIDSHQQAHIYSAHLAVFVLQATNPDLSCTFCYHPRRSSPRSNFSLFWTWYSNTYHATSFSGKTQDVFTALTTTNNRTLGRIAIRDLIFSCRYHGDVPDPREAALALIQRYTNFQTIPPLPFAQQNIFDLYIDEPRDFGIEQPADFDQYFENIDLGSPVVATTSYTNLDIPQIEYNPADSLLPYSEIVTPTLSVTSILSHTPPLQIIEELNSEEEPNQSNSEEDNLNNEEYTGEYHTPTLSPIIAPQQPPPPLPIQPNMGDVALTAAADAINALATALQNGREQTLITVEPFKGDGSQDPYTWITEFERAAQANQWENDRKLQLASVYLKGIAADWYRSLHPAPNAYRDNANPDRSFRHLFLARFSTTQQKALWQKQLFDIKQGTDTVDAYVGKFKSLRKRVDPTNVFPATFITQLFIQGLRPEYGIAVQAAEPADLNAAITAAQRWETGHVMSKPPSDTDQAIKQLTEQIAQLSINLAAKQQPPPTSVNYADAPQQAQKIKQPPTCHYCGRTGHFIANCNTRKKDESQRSNRSRYNNRDNKYSRSRSRSRDNFNRNRSRSRDRDNYRRNDNNRNRSPYPSYRSNRSPSPYYRDVYYRDQDHAPNKTPVSTSKWEALLDNPSIRAALSTHLAQQPINHQTPSNFTTPVKCNVQIRNRPYQAIIDSGASISMIAHRVVKELGLKIDQTSSSLIVAATGNSTRPLGIIRDLPVEVDNTVIPVDVEVVDVNSYSLLLGNDWSQKIEANYNWKNGCYSFKWKNKKHSIPTTYESQQPLPTKPTITDLAELGLYEQEYLTPYEAFATTVVTTSNTDTSPEDLEGWTVAQPRRRHRQPKARVCGNCGSPEHLFANCPTNKCNRCQQLGHIAPHCSQQAPKRTTCRTCNQEDHLYRHCPQNICRECNEQGHITTDCPQVVIKKQNFVYQCGCNRNEVEARRLPHHSQHRTHHCCQCLTPCRPEDLRSMDTRMFCRGCYTDFHYELDREDPRSIAFYTHGEGRGLLVECQICQKSEPCSKMYRLDSLRAELWFCDLEHLYAYKASQDVLYNPNYNLWTRIRHYTESTQNAGHQYELNQTRIFRLATIRLHESDQTILEALEPQVNDRINNEWTDEDMTLVLRAEQGLLDDEEDYPRLDQVIQNSFDTSHPDFNQEYALAQMRRSFTYPVDLCKECLHMKHQDELDRNEGYCDDCAPSQVLFEPSQPEPEPVEEIVPLTTTIIEMQQQLDNQAYLIQQLQNRIDTLEEKNAQLIQLLQENNQHFQRQNEALALLAQPQNFQ